MRKTHTHTHTPSTHLFILRCKWLIMLNLLNPLQEFAFGLSPRGLESNGKKMLSITVKSHWSGAGSIFLGPTITSLSFSSQAAQSSQLPAHRLPHSTHWRNTTSLIRETLNCFQQTGLLCHVSRKMGAAQNETKRPVQEEWRPRN